MEHGAFEATLDKKMLMNVILYHSVGSRRLRLGARRHPKRSYTHSLDWKHDAVVFSPLASGDRKGKPLGSTKSAALTRAETGGILHGGTAYGPSLPGHRYSPTSPVAPTLKPSPSPRHTFYHTLDVNPLPVSLAPSTVLQQEIFPQTRWTQRLDLRQPRPANQAPRSTKYGLI